MLKRTGWNVPPDLPSTHYLDNRIHTEERIFAAEQAAIFRRCWKFLYLASELPNAGDFRVAELGGIPIVTVRDRDGTLRSFYNVCPHRGAPLVRVSHGNLARGFRCLYHLWTYALDGACTSISRVEGYKNAGLTKDQVRLRNVRTETMAGLVFVTLDDDAPPLENFLGGMRDHIERHCGAEELELFHFHRADIATNWKLWVDNNSEVYHDLMHVVNRRTGVSHPAYHTRRWKLYPNAMNVILEGAMNYESAGWEGRDSNMMPGIGPNGMVILEVFPDVMINIRATAMRIDSITPIAAGRSIIEYRGVGLKSDTPEVRAKRIRHHNQIWGPAGRNLPEDNAVVELQWRNMASGAARYSIIAREEELKPHDDSPLRAWYQEWGRRVGVWPHDIDAPRAIVQRTAEQPATAAHG